MTKFHVGITIDKNIYRQIEELRGREKRSTFMEHLLTLGLNAHREKQE